jgi:subtilisin-like proprotein convertase family protein
MVPPLRALALAVFLLPLALAAPAQAAVTISHAGAQAVEVTGNQDDVVTPGDFIRIEETVAAATALSDATGTLLTPTPGLTINNSTSPYPDTPAGGQATNTTPFEATLGGSVPCGSLLQFTLSMSATGGIGSTSFSVGTGAAGPPAHYDDASGAHALNDAGVGEPAGVTNLEMGILQTGRVKQLTVRVGSLTHPRLADLRLALLAPEGQEIVLAEAGDLNGTALTNTVFAAGATAPITSGAAPYTGTYTPRGDLGSLEGRLLNGTWTLKVTDTVTGETGTVNGWRISASRAFCSGIPKARFAMTPSETTPGGTVQFDGSASSDGAGTIEEYAWDLDGDGEYDDGSTAQVQRTYPVKAKVPVRLRVTDDDGLTDVEHQDLPVTVKPVAAISSSPTDPAPLTGETVRLSAAGSTDPDGTIARYEWNTDGVGAYELDSQGTNFVDVTYARAGVYNATVRVTDDTGSRDTESVQVVVRNRPPVAAIADPGLVVRDRPATLSAQGSTDPEGAALTYRWDLDDDGVYETDSGTSETVQHTFTTHGEVTIGVQVTDNARSTDTETRTILVTRAPAVQVTATPNPVSLRDTVTFDASASQDSDDPAAALTFEWDLENDGTFAAPGAATASASWPTPGTRTVKVRVTDPTGAATVGSLNVVVRNVLPIAALSATPASPKVGQATQLSAAGATDPDGTVVRYQWDLDGDGSYERDTGTTPSTSATFANHGNLTVGVRVTDDDGGTGTKTLTLAVARPDEPPPPPPPTDEGEGGEAPVKPATTPDPGTVEQGPPPPGGEEPALGGEDVLVGTDPDRPFGAWLGGAAIQRTRLVLARGVLLSCRSEVAARCSLTVTVAAADAKRLRLGRRRVVVARGALAVPQGQSARSRIKLSARARRALRGANRVRLLARATVRAGDGREVELSRVVLLRR